MKNKKIILKVIFDTNVIHTNSESCLLREEFCKLINLHQGHNDVELQRFLPSIVIGERRFQMNQKALELLQPIQRLEKLIWHPLHITNEVIESKISEVIEKQIKDLGISTVDIQTKKVNRDNVISKSLQRIAPFEKGDKEKWFRDMMILECFKQIIESSHKTPSICRIILVTNDDLLVEAAKEETRSKKNVYIHRNIDELTNLINTLESEMTESLINKIIPEAEILFFNLENQSGLFYSENIKNEIKNKFHKELNSLHKWGETRENGTWKIGNIVFETKKKQKVFWKASITIDFVCFKKSESHPIYIQPYNNISLWSTYSSSPITSSDPWLLNWHNISSLELFNGNTSSNLSLSNNRIDRETVNIKACSGSAKFEVLWTTILTKTGKLTSPKIESIDYIDTIIN